MDKDEIWEIIAKLFKEKGFYNTSISDISERVGLKRGALYYHIKSKEDALFRIFEDDAVNTHLANLEAISKNNDDPKTKLKKIVENHIDFFSSSFYKISVFLIETKSLGDRYQKVYSQKRDKLESYVRNVLREGIKKGAFRNGDVKLMGFAILGMLNWMAIWYKPEGKWGPKKLKKEFVAMILSGIKK